MSQAGKAYPTSGHFSLEQLADGVYAALSRPGSPTFSNAAIVDLGERTLVFDAFELPEAAQDLRAAAEALTGRPVTLVINSHSHWDHWGGNQVFAPPVSIVAARATRQEMPASSEWVRGFYQDPSQLEQAIAENRRSQETEMDEGRRTALARSLPRMERMLAALPTLEFRYPDLVFAREMVFYGSKRRAELVTVAPAHTVCDAYLHLPQDRIVLMGDLGFFQSQPFMAFCDPPAWRAWLAEAEGWDVEVWVPGHGPLGTRADLALQREYLDLVERMVDQAVEAGLTVEEMLAQPLPAPFDAWRRDSFARWETNVHTLYERRATTPKY